MSDPTKDGSGSFSGDRSGRVDGGVHFEETITISDSRFAGVSKLAAGVALVASLGTLVVAPLLAAAFFGFVGVASGTSPVDVVTTIASDLPLPVLLSLGVFAVLFFGLPLVGVVNVVRRGSLTPKNEVHTRVTDSGVDIDRTGGYRGHSPGVTIPFEAITTVEYCDPEGDLRVNLEDARSKKFIAGRSRDWVRIGRSDGRAVYVGSDRHRELAGTIADLAPAVDGAEPFS